MPGDKRGKVLQQMQTQIRNTHKSTSNKNTSTTMETHDIARPQRSARTTIPQRCAAPAQAQTTYQPPPLRQLHRIYPLQTQPLQLRRHRLKLRRWWHSSLFQACSLWEDGTEQKGSAVHGRKGTHTCWTLFKDSVGQPHTKRRRTRR